MGYSGYEILLCSNGHRHDFDAWDACYGNTSRVCPDCGAAFVWDFPVDTTNDAGIRPVLIENHAVVIESCHTCGNTTVVEGATYFIPTNRGRLLVPKEEVNARFIDTDVLFPEDWTEEWKREYLAGDDDE